ncbi:LysE family transporter [uncultured Campylobacter sp.]|uniref:LysE family transporter n=1 Tax=uncultured Campylobacter sp. TaxID=218934 RepID=UPI002635273E|nr:LysE family transporter [uncultured Campylobacter sp.]
MTFLFIFAIHLSALLTPGPDFFLVSTYALKFSFKEALKAAFGVSLAILLWIIFSLTGLKILFDTFPFIQLVLSTLGAMYLFYLAYLLLKNISNEIHFTDSVKISKPFLGGFLTNITNAKAIFYFGSIFSSLNFMGDNFEIFLLIILLSLESLICFVLLFL